MIARWPGKIKPSQTSDLPWAGWDIMATLADLAGVPPPDQQENREYLYWEHHMGKQQAIRMGKWKGIRFGGTKEPIELYDLSVDIGKTNNVAEDHPEIIE